MKNRRTRPIIKPNPFNKFLKPGTLAKIRDSQITARRTLFRKLNAPSHRIPSPLPPSNDAVPTHQNDTDGFPCFASRTFSPRCPQRKKLVASKSVFFVSASPVRSTSDSPDTPRTTIENLASKVL
ncbi:hypothetical protein RIF29_31586 [Crotalaria pallida]|uniref:Uncharacterized protein n=1 Tax=Crotalaria pallida TaxID=3830 RepID=A0AAN9HXP4_CROPI